MDYRVSKGNSVTKSVRQQAQGRTSNNTALKEICRNL